VPITELSLPLQKRMTKDIEMKLGPCAKEKQNLKRLNVRSINKYWDSLTKKLEKT